MCGICGYIKFSNGVSDEDKNIIDRMNKKLIHRGPDAQDTLLFENVALGFSRLSIIGLQNGMQPIYNEDKSIVLICNGEIFNYIELKATLESKGHTFGTQSDVEVILHLYEEHGVHFLNQLNGQFGFALYDMKKKQLFCARDHFGIIPFFYTFIKNNFIFGSEIKAILEHPLVIPEIDMVGFDQVMTFAGLISPRTMFRNINSLENGHMLLVDRHGEIKKQEYWDLIYPEDGVIRDDKPEAYYVENLEKILNNAVRLRLRSEVPYGLYLSGGLDSSIIAMKMSQLDTQNRREAFSIDFVDSQLSETIYQNLVAKESGARINRKTFFSEDISTRLQQVIYHCECPIKETYNTASLSLSKSVRDRGIKVILSGEGADEFFAGYVGYRFDRMRAMGMLKNVSCELEDKLKEKVWGDKDFFYETQFGAFEQTKKQLYSEHYRSAFDEINCLNHFVINKKRLEGRDLLHKRAYVDYKLRLVDHLVSDHGDRMALANSIEVRYPFLDKELAEFATTIPAALKLSEDLSEKYILKKMASKFVPNQIIDREKFGFVAPGSPYLLQNNIEYINDILSYEQVKRQGYFDPDQIESLKSTYKQEGYTINAPFESDLLTPVITFGILLDQFLT